MVRNIVKKVWLSPRHLKKLWPSPWVVAKIIPVLGAVVLALGGYMIGRGALVSRAPGQQVTPGAVNGAAVSDAYKQRIVAHIHGTIPVTREELGEFLIHRLGAERLEMCVHNKIIEMACKAKGIHVTDQEVEVQFQLEFQQAKAVSPTLTVQEFERVYLKHKGRNLIEFKEDIIRTKLMLAQLVMPSVQVTDEDLRKGFEGRYGEKRECRMIVLKDDHHKFDIWNKVKDSEAEFNRVATTLNMSPLNAQGGKVPPIHKHFGDPNIERAAFSLKPGEVSPIIGLPDGTVVILKCDRHIPADTTKRFENELPLLRTEIFNFKLNQRIEEARAELHKQANPRLLLQRQTRQQDLERDVVPEIGGAPRQQKAGG
jgi:hypothetical protein